MVQKRENLIVRLLHRSAIARWAKAARGATSADLDVLRDQRYRARQIRAHVDELMHVADSRLALPRIGSNAFTRPGGTEWSWRPRLWRGPLARKGMSAVPSKMDVGEEVTVFHDCKISELTLRQIRNTREADLAPFGLRMDVFRFDGSFLSVVIDAPQTACEGLQRRHIVRVNAIMEVEKPIEIFARLNIKHGPNTEQLVLELPHGQEDSMVEFDLGYSELNEKRIERMWLDLIFESPEMNQVTIRDITFCRYTRAEI
ncbi:MAG: hypothetical protein ACI82I_001655 [Gammaproteobacteria bacterium]|jgi:hypothetical protein